MSAVIKVRTLVWTLSTHADSFPTWRAAHGQFRWTIKSVPNGQHVLIQPIWEDCSPLMDPVSRHGTLEAAQTEAQYQWEAFILSAIESPSTDRWPAMDNAGRDLT